MASSRQDSGSAPTAEPSGGRSKLLGFLGRIGMAEVVVFALTVALGVWSWLAYVVNGPQDFPTFTIVFLGVTLLGAATQMIFFLFVRPVASVRARLTLQSVGNARSGSSVVLWGPPVIYAVVFLLVTPPTTPAAGFDPDMGIYQVMGLVILLSLVATAVGTLALYCVIILPLVLILNGVLPAARDARGRTVPSVVSRTEYVCGGLIILLAVAFAILMQFVGGASASLGIGAQSSYGRMLQQLVAFVTFNGAPVASILAVGCLIAIAILIVISNRATARRWHGLIHRSHPSRWRAGRGDASPGDGR